MSDVTIRRMTDQEVQHVFSPLTSYAFHPSPPFRDEEDWEALIHRRKNAVYLGAFEGDQGVAAAVNSPMTQHVRWAILGAGAVWGVTTAPEARRKGTCRRLMAQILARDREEGRPVSCLYPFRASFYERLGYVSFPLAYNAVFQPAPLVPLLKQDLGGTVERMLVGEGYDAYRAYTKRMQARTHGMAVFLPGEKEQVQKENRSWLALARVDGEVVGVMLYALTGDEITRFTLRAYRFYYDTSQARYLLLQWIARHVDQASQVKLWLPPFERPATWMDDLQISLEAPARGAMGRVVDISGLDGIEIGAGAFTARVSDPLCPWNDAVWRFETVDGQLRVSPAAQAECHLTIQALTALVYGTNDPGDFEVRGWGDPSPQLQTTMRTMFARRLPYLHEAF